ncbi:50S ribosomal protein L22 [Candidatus Gracilibacteria bacterium]|nr:50S ribosomal protein L22 [Candidatus Gracilibacteria bacterium]
MKAYLKNVRISPKKLRVSAEVVRGKKVDDALKFLRFAPNKGAKILYKVMYSALKNAENNNNQEIDNLYVGSLIVTKGIVYKRGQSISRGRMHSILKRTSNVILELQVK